jgi:NitT/TauT family transport system permease protein
MTAEVDTGVVRSTTSSQPALVPAASRRWQRLRRTALVVATQIAILAAFLAFWEYMTSQSRAAAFMFGSPSAIAGFLVQMVRDGSLWRDSHVTGSRPCSGSLSETWSARKAVAVVFAVRVARRRAFVIAVGSILIIALAPIIIIWFGTGLISKVAMSTPRSSSLRS